MNNPIMRDDDRLDSINRAKPIEEELAQFYAAKERRCKIGRIIVFTIATVNVITAVIGFFLNANVLTLAFQILWSVLLYIGVSWVRYFVAVGASLSALLSGFILFVNIVVPNDDRGFGLIPTEPTATYYGTMAFWAVYFAYSLTSAVLLFRNECVSEFLYRQKEDRV